MLELDVLRDIDSPEIPTDEDFIRWASTAAGDAPASLALRIVDNEESQTLNRTYRDKDRPTNVLSFPADLPDEILEALDSPPLGDLVICAPLVAEEARAQGKPESAHWAHLTIHGVLHLRGYDHENESDAARMEALETRLLSGLGIADPYNG